MKKERSKSALFTLVKGYFEKTLHEVAGDLSESLGREATDFIRFCKETRSPLEAAFFCHFLAEEAGDGEDAFVWTHLIPLTMLDCMIQHHVSIVKTQDVFGFPSFGFDIESNDEADVAAFDELHGILASLVKTTGGDAIRIYANAARAARAACDANAEYIGYYREGERTVDEPEPPQNSTED